MTPAADIQAEATRIAKRFAAAGAIAVDCDVLQPAEVLLDLYGEDIRARAYVTQDPLRGEQMLRPDFTVPVVRRHMEVGAEPARYTYLGKVFRRQEDNPDKPSEYVQVGYELFERSDPEASDAEVFATILDALGAAPLRASVGDIGILTAAVGGLPTSDARKAALLRHLWRPARFRALVQRYAGHAVVPEHRAALLASDDPLACAGPMIGLRGRDEIETRIETLRADAAEGPIAPDAVAALEALMQVRGPVPEALRALETLAGTAPSVGPAVQRFARRAKALSARGIDISQLDFEASYGRTSLEYYDGFVFGFYPEARPDLQPVASGGRYDAMTRILGQGSGIPAVGGVIIPERLLAVRDLT